MGTEDLTIRGRMDARDKKGSISRSNHTKEILKELIIYYSVAGE